MTVLNIAAYHFVELEDLPGLRQTLHDLASVLALRGTILLAPEGINLFLAGEPEAIHGFLAQLRAEPRFATLHAKFSESADVPFRKLRVRIKREIIRMNHPTIRPIQGRAPSVNASTLQRWLADGHDDQGRPVLMLDTRNGFEVDAGTFHNALHFGIERFTQFPEAVLARREELAGKAVVTFCTGGIRCEKAALFMEQAGIEGVYQLEGGILQYFEETDGRDYTGGCFVFDERGTLDPGLRPLAPEAGPSSVASA